MSPDLADRYDALLLDLDGVVYRGNQAIPAAVRAIAELRDRGATVLFLTNNSARTPSQVAEWLQGLGVAARPGDVLTSAVAAAAMLRDEFGPGRSVFVIGERGIREALEEAGLVLVDGEPDRVDLVVVGWDRSVDYAKLRTASLLVERGARLVATNGDPSYPAPDGMWPGAGAILATITTTTGAEPVVVGKPSRPLFEAAAQLTGGGNPLVVGDRLDTDIRGAAAVGWDSLLVGTGAAGPADLPMGSALPTYLAADVSVLVRDPGPIPFRPRPAVAADVPEIERLLSDAGLVAAGAEDRLAETVVAEHDGSLVATACLEQIGGELGGGAILRSVAVRTDLREAGMGTLITAAAIQAGRGRGVRRVFLFTETAEPFFARLGFRSMARGDLPPAVAASERARYCPDAVAMELVLEAAPHPAPGHPGPEGS
jgi:glycerol-1-phosphatase